MKVSITCAVVFVDVAAPMYTLQTKKRKNAALALERELCICVPIT